MVVLYIVLKKMATVKKVAVIKKYEDIQKMNTHTHNFQTSYIQYPQNVGAAQTTCPLQPYGVSAPNAW